MADRTLVVSATNLLRRGFLLIPTDRASTTGAPVNGLFAVARAIHRALAFKRPARAVAVVDPAAPEHTSPAWPEILCSQLAPLAGLLRTLGIPVVESDRELDLVASYACAALSQGDDAIIVGVDKRYAQLVNDRLWWYDANKDARYTKEIVSKRFNVAPDKVAAWLALVGDEDQLPGVKGIGAKGATTLVELCGSIEAAVATADTMEGRLGKALRAAAADIPSELARAKLATSLPLPVALAQLGYAPPQASSLNALYSELGFAELLVAASDAPSAELCQRPEDVAHALAQLGPGTITLHALLEDPAPVFAELTGIALANGNGQTFYVAKASAAWPTLSTWLTDANAPKQGHDLVGTMVALRRAGVTLAGVVGDSAVASHLTEPSNWAPHDLALVAKRVLGRALPEDDSIRGVGRARKAWALLGIDRAANAAGERADASAAIWARLSKTIDPTLCSEYLELSETLVRMELTGLAVDADELARAEASFVTIEAELERAIAELAGHSFNINSGKQLGDVLFEKLKLPVVSHTKTGWSTANEALERIEHAHPIVPLVIRYRTLRRLRDSWVVALQKCIAPDGRVHSRFHPARSFSGHLINTNPDLARVPGRTPEMARIRRAFVAPPGRCLMSVDFSQLGLFVLAHLTKDPSLIEPLRQRADMHRLTAAAVLEKPPEAVSLEERQTGKVVNFATFAGQGASALALSLGIPPHEAKAYIARFDRHYASVRTFQDEQLRLAREQGYIVTIAGRHWPIGGLESLDPHDRSYAERLARRATHEGSVADVSRRALLHADRALRKAGLGAVPLLQILDEVLFEVPESELEAAAKLCSEAMRHAFELEVPLVVGVWVGPNWADLEPIA